MSAFNPDPPIIAQPCFKVVIYGELYDQQTVNTFFYARQAETANVAPPGTILSLFIAACGAAWEAAVSNDWVSNHARCYRLDDPAMLVAVDDPQFAGTVAEDSVPTTVAARLRRQTGHGGAKGRGMVRLAGIPRTAIDNGLIDAAEVVLLQTLVTAWLQVLTPVDATQGTYAPFLIKRSGLPGPPPLVVNRGSQVLQWIIEATPGHQNSRQARVGGE